MHFSEQTVRASQTRQERDARYNEMKTIANSMVDTEVIIRSNNKRLHEGLVFTLEGTLQTDGYGGYHINNIAVRLDFTASQIQGAWVAASGNIIRLY